jgi:tetratricopeptide (TPR) repeat protein/DNA-binding CsgD family transcriptional regulator
MNRLILTLRFSLLFLILGIACKSPIKQDKSVEQLVSFNPSIATADLQLKNAEKQWEYVTTIVKNKYTNPDQVEKWLFTVLPILCSQKEEISVDALRELNLQLYQTNYNQAAVELAKRTLKDFNSEAYSYAHATAIALLVKHYNFLQNKDSMAIYIPLLERAIEIDTAGWLKINYFSNKAYLSKLNGKFFEAIVYYHKAIEYIPADDSTNLSVMYHDLASTYYSLEDIEKAAKYLDLSVDMVGMEKYPVHQLNFLGIIQSKTKEFDKAEQSFNRVIEYAKKNAVTGLLAQSYANYGNLKRKEKKYSEALRYMQLSDSLCEILKIDVGILINQINRAELFFDQRNFQYASDELLKGKKFLFSFNDPVFNMDYYGLLYKIYDSIGDQNKANLNYRLYIENKEKFIGDLPRSVISEWELGREREKINTTKTEYELSLQKQIKTNYLIAFIAALGLFFLTLIFYVINKKNIRSRELLHLEKQRIAHELEMKSKELLSESLKNISIQNTKEWVKEELDQIVNELPKVHQQKFEALHRKLRTGNTQSFMEEFETRFTGVYEEFYTKIKAVAPDLTPHEVRICALMRLNISTKEMAMLTNRTVGTIDNTRSSIRKKLRLDESTNLQQYLMEL